MRPLVQLRARVTPPACLPTASALQRRAVHVDRAVALHGLYQRYLPDLWPSVGADGHLPLAPNPFYVAHATALTALRERYGCPVWYLADLQWQEQEEYDYYLQDDGEEPVNPNDFAPSWLDAIPIEAGAVGYHEPPKDAPPLELLLYAVLRDENRATAQEARRALGGGTLPAALVRPLVRLLRPVPPPPAVGGASRLSDTSRRTARQLAQHRQAYDQWLAQHAHVRARLDRARGTPLLQRADALADLPIFAHYLCGDIPNPFLAAGNALEDLEDAQAFAWSAYGVAALLAAWDDAEETVARTERVRAALRAQPEDAAHLLAALLVAEAARGGATAAAGVTP